MAWRLEDPWLSSSIRWVANTRCNTNYQFEGGLSEECPIVNTNPDNLKEQLIKLITNPQLRHNIGIKSRAFAEKFHDVNKISGQLLEIYKLELEKMHNAEIS